MTHSNDRPLPPRRSGNNKRRLLTDPSEALINDLLRRAHYGPSAKHKRHPHLYGLEPFRGNRGDATLCDAHAGFTPAQASTIPALLERGIQAGLIGDTQRVIWTVADNGWIYEARRTNPASHEFHGYPLRPGELVVASIYRRFATWADVHGTPADRTAALECRHRYGVR